MPDLSIVFIADLRFPGGTSTSLFNELHAARRAGLSCAVAPFQSALLTRSRPPNKRLMQAISELDVPVLPAGGDYTAALALVCHPSLYATPPTRRPPITADHFGVIAHHPIRDADGHLAMDYCATLDTIRDIHRRDAVVLPVGPAVRESFASEGLGKLLHARDWTNMIDASLWPHHKVRSKPDHLIIGRHSRPDRLKWPEMDDALRAYPPGDRLQFRMLGVDRNLRDIFSPWPGNWRALPFAETPDQVQHFLGKLDAYSYYHHPAWIEAFGYNVLEALAAGLPVVLPPHFKATFGDCAIYAPLGEAADVYEQLSQDDDLRRDLSSRARNAAEDRYGYDTYEARVRYFLGEAPAHRAHYSLRPPKRPDTVMVITSNGVGAGHVTRQIAIAEQQPVDIRTVFFSLSLAMGYARDAGYLAEYRPFHRHVGMSQQTWNLWFRGQVTEAIRFYEPASIVFDGNMPYQGMLDALDAFPAVSRIWVRRGMWRNPNTVARERARKFDLVIEPADLSEAVDPGHVAADGDPVAGVPPILRIPATERLSSRIARRLLELPEEGHVFVLQLGSGSNFDMSAAREQTITKLLSDPSRVVVELANPLTGTEITSEHPRHLIRTLFPAAQYFAAFEGAVMATGYNSFHETLFAGLPTLFVPNTAPEMDLQERRATHAAMCGRCLTARADDRLGLSRELNRLLDSNVRAGIRENCGAITVEPNGARLAAELIALVTRQIPVLRT